MLKRTYLLSIWLLLASFSFTNSKPQNQQPPREERSEKAQAEKGNSNAGKQNTAITEIECDPTCAAKSAKEDGNDGRIARLVNKIIDDPLTIFTGLLAIATFSLVLVVLCQLRDARESSKRQLRAYVGVDDIDIEAPHLNDAEYEIPDPPPAGYIWSDLVRVRVGNQGATPASVLIIVANWQQMIPLGRLLPNDFPYGDLGPDRDIAHKFILEPGKNHIAKIRIDKLKTFREAEKKLCSLYIYGHIDYRDIFDRVWQRDFCFAYEPWRPAGDRYCPYGEHNRDKQIK